MGEWGHAMDFSFFFPRQNQFQVEQQQQFSDTKAWRSK